MSKEEKTHEEKAAEPTTVLGADGKPLSGGELGTHDDPTGEKFKPKNALAPEGKMKKRRKGRGKKGVKRTVDDEGNIKEKGPKKPKTSRAHCERCVHDEICPYRAALRQFVYSGMASGYMPQLAGNQPPSCWDDLQHIVAKSCKRYLEVYDLE